MSLVLRKAPCSSHRAAQTFEALIGTSLIVVLGFLVSTETKMVLFLTMEKNNFALNGALVMTLVRTVGNRPLAALL